MAQRPDPLASRPPAFGVEAARQILRDGFGAEASSLTPLAGERDQNLRVDTSSFASSQPAARSNSRRALHDYLAGQRQLALSPAAVSELLARLEAQWEDVLVLSSDSLIFRLTARQKRTQRIIAAVSAPTGAALAGLGIAADKYVIGYVLMLVAAGALLATCMSLNNTRAFTECTPSSLRARTVLGRLREWPWPQVANISVKEVSGRGSTYSAVMVTTTAGRRIRLAAPTSGILTPEEFTTSAKQIQDYWRAATAATGQPSEP